MVAIEAMAAGLPVMALKKGGMPEYMVDADNALLLDAQASAKDIARSIERAAGNPVSLDAIAASARRLVEKRFDWSRVATATEQLYDEVLSATGKVM